MLEGGDHREDDLPLLDGLHPPGSKALAVPDPVDLVDDGQGHVPGAKEVGVRRVGQPGFDGAAGRHHCLPDDLAAEDRLATQVAGLAAEEIHLQRLEVEHVDEIFERRGRCVGHGNPPPQRTGH
jgi:hypothetical protein